MNNKLSGQLELSHRLEQQQMLSLKILAMNNYELNQFIISEATENPLVEIASVSGQELFFDYKDYKRTRIDNGIDCDTIAYVVDDYCDNYELFISQLNLCCLTEKQVKLLKELIDLMDDGGYIRLTIEELQQIFTYGYEEIKECLNIIQHLEPYGSGAYDLRECLKLQLESQGLFDEMTNEIIDNHLENIAYGKLREIESALSLDQETVIKYTKLIKSLNPRPLNGLTKGKNDYIVPDLLFVKDEAGWSVLLNDSWMNKFNLSQEYLGIKKNSWDKAAKNYYNEKLNRARLIERCVAQRKETLLKLGEYILSYQVEHIEDNTGLRPLTMSQIAEVLEVHESTISRTIKDKYVQYPKGTVLLKQFLVNAVSNTDGNENLSSDYVKKTLKLLIDQENKKKPLSDNQLCQMLKEKGMDISRRTVAKYRGNMGILSTQQRKQL